MSCTCIALLTEIGFFAFKALIKIKRFAVLKGTNSCSQCLQEEIFEEQDLWLQGFLVVNVKIILAL